MANFTTLLSQTGKTTCAWTACKETDKWSLLCRHDQSLSHSEPLPQLCHSHNTDTAHTRSFLDRRHKLRLQAACDWSSWDSSIVCHYCGRPWKCGSSRWTVIPNKILPLTTVAQLLLEMDCSKRAVSAFVALWCDLKLKIYFTISHF